MHVCTVVTSLIYYDKFVNIYVVYIEDNVLNAAVVQILR